MLIRVGSRGSRLALTQAELVVGHAVSSRQAGGIEIAFVPITTAGDRDRKSPFGQIGERGVFVKEIEEALLGGRIDVAVHSAKDMTSTDSDGLTVGAYLERDDPRDALVGADAAASRGCGSARPRSAAGRSCWRSSRRCWVEPLRGNIDTRLRKARERGLDALVLAACGLDRLGLADEIGLRLPVGRCCPRPRRARSRCRCVRARRSWSRLRDHAETRRRVEAERACVAQVGAGCLAPVAAHHDGEQLHGADRRRGRQLDRAYAAAPIQRRSPSSCSRRRGARGVPV